MLALSCIVMGVFLYTLSNTRSALAMPLLGALFVVLAWAWYRFRGVTDASVERGLFPIALICLALMYGLVFPPESVPDGAYHYKVSYYCANLIEHSDNPHLIRAEDEELLRVADGVPIIVDKSSIAPIKHNLSAFDANGELI
ncbi:MAG: hypothetical protein Q4D34_07265 [Eggerthellaceae bacterium]|nr:hypothetical protein [Eggerthellaceae bacterium]